MTTVRESELLLHALTFTTLLRTFTVRNRSTKTPVDLTGWTPSLWIFDKQGGTKLYELGPSNGFTIPTPSNGEMKLEVYVDPSALPPAFNLAVGTYWYRVRLTSGAGVVWALWPGPFMVSPQ